MSNAPTIEAVAADVATLKVEQDRLRSRVHDMAGKVGAAGMLSTEVEQLRETVEQHAKRDEEKFGEVISEVKKVREGLLGLKTEKRVVITAALVLAGAITAATGLLVDQLVTRSLVKYGVIEIRRTP